MPRSYELLNAAIERITAAIAKGELPDDDTLAGAANFHHVFCVLQDGTLRRHLAEYPDERRPYDWTDYLAAEEREKLILERYLDAANGAMPVLRTTLWLARRMLSDSSINADEFLQGLARGDIDGPFTWANFRAAVASHRISAPRKTFTVAEAANEVERSKSSISDWAKAAPAMVAERNGAKVSRVFADVLYAEAARHLRRERAESEDQVQELMKKTEESQPRTSNLPVRKNTPSKKL